MSITLPPLPGTADAARAAPLDGVYREHRAWLFGWLRKKVSSSERAEDLTQDVFVRIMQGRKEVRADEARSLLTTIAKGLVIDYYRRAAIEHAYLDYLGTLAPDTAPSPEERALQLQALVQLDRLLDGLPPNVRRAFLFSQLEGMTYPQIAARLNVSVSSVQQYMVRAMHACYSVFYG